ncbi:MAG: hypothetical protein KGL39_42010 [Patescibacteria group bacterium]|nr:hypothetical protein [Patescibacteria group bacterium]
MTEVELPIEPISEPRDFRAMLADYVELEERRRRLEDDLAACKQAASAIEQKLLEQFADIGLQNARVGNLTVYVRHDRYVSRRKEVTNEEMCEILRNLGLGYMVSDGYNAASLKSKIKEYQDHELEVPPALAGALNIGEVPRLATRL